MCDVVSMTIVAGGQTRHLNGVGRGCGTVDDQLGQYTQPLQMSNGQSASMMSFNETEQHADRLAPHLPLSTPVSNTQVKPESVKQRVATATPAFSLNGVGRGKMISPPS